MNSGINRRDATQHPLQPRVLGRNRLAAKPGHLGEARPFGVFLECPVRLVVGLVPEHHRFDHCTLPVLDRRQAAVRTEFELARRQT